MSFVDGDASAAGWHRRVLGLAGPIILSNLSTPLLGAVDTAVVGHLANPAYIGGVAIGAMVFSFLYWGFGFLRMGTTGFTAQAFGAGDAAELRATFLRPILLAGLFGVSLILLQIPIGWIAFRLVPGSAEVRAAAEAYYHIRIWSAPATLVNYTVLGWLLGTRRVKAALALQVLLNLVNIALDLFFVLVLGMATEGVALATLIGEVLTAGLGLVLVLRVLAGEGGRWDWGGAVARARLVALFRVNADIFIRTLCLIFAFGFFTTAGAGMGDVTLAANAILLNLQTFAAYGLDGFAHATEILAGAAVGARNLADFRRAVRVAGLWALLMAVAVAAAYAFAGPWIIRLFTSIAAVRANAGLYLPWMMLSPLVSVWSFLLDGIFIGSTRTGEMRNAMMLSLAAYLLAAWLLLPAFGNHGLWLALMLFMASRAVTLALFYPRIERGLQAGRG